MPPPLDAKTRTGTVTDIARRLGEMQGATPESQLEMARTVESKIFESAKNEEDYRKKIEKRMTKAVRSRVAQFRVLADARLARV